jgi:hypothetical protein
MEPIMSEAGEMAIDSEKSRLLSPRQLAMRSGWSEKRVRTLIRQMKLQHIQVGSSVLLPSDAIERFVEANMFTPKADKGARTPK